MFLGLSDISRHWRSSVTGRWKLDPLPADGVWESFGLRWYSSACILCWCRLWQHTTM